MEVEGLRHRSSVSVGDFGDIVTYIAECPTCHADIEVGEEDHAPRKCSCGFEWSVQVRVVGYKASWDDEPEDGARDRRDA